MGGKAVHSILPIHLQRYLKPAYSLISSKTAQIPRLWSLMDECRFSPSAERQNEEPLSEIRTPPPHWPRKPLHKVNCDNAVLGLTDLTCLLALGHALVTENMLDDSQGLNQGLPPHWISSTCLVLVLWD